MWIYEQAPNPQISVSSWRLAEAKHRLLPKIRASPSQKNVPYGHFQKPIRRVETATPALRSSF